MTKQKLLFIYLRTGGGHLAPARSVADYINKYKNQEAETLLIDGFEKTKWFSRFIIEDGYRHLQIKAKWFYEFLYATHKLKFISHISAFLVSINITKYLRELFCGYQPDKIVIFHFFLIKPVYSTLKKLKKEIPVITVVTDPFTAHPLWFLRRDQNFILFSEKLKQSCTADGIHENNLNVFPFILGEKFSSLPSEEVILFFRKKYGIEKQNVLLILGGGDGIPKGVKILKRMLKSNIGFSIIIVCGKNKRLFKQASRLKNEITGKDLMVFGFVDIVYELLCLSDIVITKCGASTFMEILVCGKIPVVNSYIWEQEKGNVDFIIENQLGVYEKRVRKLPGVVENLFDSKVLLDSYKKNIFNAGLENGTVKVAEFICKF
ncbi:MAG: glycosyltransferase [Melioribacteraceae bacterium]|nr:glycosyltransferase [Melioribacteraceae bacterium]